MRGICISILKVLCSIFGTNLHIFGICTFGPRGGKFWSKKKMLPVRTSRVLRLRPTSDLHSPRLSSSSSSPPSPPSTYSTIAPSSILVTPSHPRPSPTILGIHGLRATPFWSRQTSNQTEVAFNDSKIRDIVQALEANHDTIRREYTELESRVGNDYNDGSTSADHHAAQFVPKDPKDPKVEKPQYEFFKKKSKPLSSLHSESLHSKIESKSNSNSNSNSNSLHSGSWDWRSFMKKGVFPPPPPPPPPPSCPTPRSPTPSSTPSSPPAPSSPEPRSGTLSSARWAPGGRSPRTPGRRTFA